MAGAAGETGLPSCRRRAWLPPLPARALTEPHLPTSSASAAPVTVGSARSHQPALRWPRRAAEAEHCLQGGSAARTGRGSGDTRRHLAPGPAVDEEQLPLQPTHLHRRARPTPTSTTGWICLLSLPWPQQAATESFHSLSQARLGCAEKQDAQVGYPSHSHCALAG